MTGYFCLNKAGAKLRWFMLPALLLSGCATAPHSADAVRDLALASPAALTAVPLNGDAPLLGNQPIKGQLGPSAPVVTLEQGNSYYRLYRLTQSGGAIHLKVISYCACFGYDKRVAVPVVRVLTKTGQVIAPSPDGYEYVQEGAHGFTPLSVTLDVTVPGADAAYALVAADNSRTGESLHRINVAGLMQLDISADPAGSFDIRYVSP